MKSCKRYASQIVFQGKTRYIGVFSTPEEAARKFDEARILIVSKLDIHTTCSYGQMREIGAASLRHLALL